jgi:hypothetical protein
MGGFVFNHVDADTPSLDIETNQKVVLIISEFNEPSFTLPFIVRTQLLLLMTKLRDSFKGSKRAADCSQDPHTAGSTTDIPLDNMLVSERQSQWPQSINVPEENDVSRVAEKGPASEGNIALAENHLTVSDETSDDPIKIYLNAARCSTSWCHP